MARELVKPQLGTVLKGYLSLMNEFDNEDLVDAFESIMIIFAEDMRPYAVDICTHLASQYIRCVTKYRTANNGNESLLSTALASFTSMSRIVDFIKLDASLLH